MPLKYICENCGARRPAGLPYPIGESWWVLLKRIGEPDHAGQIFCPKCVRLLLSTGPPFIEDDKERHAAVNKFAQSLRWSANLERLHSKIGPKDFVDKGHVRDEFGTLFPDEQDERGFPEEDESEL